MQTGTTYYRQVRVLIYKLDGGKCHICGGKVQYKDSVLDHIIPKVAPNRFGIQSSDKYWNLRLAHKGCNSRRCDAKIGGQLRLHIVNG